MVVKLAGDKGLFKCFLCVNCIVCDQKLMTKIAKIQIKKINHDCKNGGR